MLQSRHPMTVKKVGILKSFFNRRNIHHYASQRQNWLHIWCCCCNRLKRHFIKTSASNFQNNHVLPSLMLRIFLIQASVMSQPYSTIWSVYSLPRNLILCSSNRLLFRGYKAKHDCNILNIAMKVGYVFKTMREACLANIWPVKLEVLHAWHDIRAGYRSRWIKNRKRRLTPASITIIPLRQWFGEKNHRNVWPWTSGTLARWYLSALLLSQGTRMSQLDTGIADGPWPRTIEIIGGCSVTSADRPVTCMSKCLKQSVPFSLTVRMSVDM